MSETSHQALIVFVPDYADPAGLFVEIERIAADLGPFPGSSDHTLMDLVVRVPTVVNGGETLLVALDGSKLGWPKQQHAFYFRNRIIDLLEGDRYEDGSIATPYALVAMPSSSGMESTTLLATSDGRTESKRTREI